MNQVQPLNQKMVPPNLLVTFFKGWPGSVPTCTRRAMPFRSISPLCP